MGGLVDGLFGSGSSSDPSSVWAVQSPYLDMLYRRTARTADQTQGTDYLNQFLNPASQGYDQMLAGGYQMPGMQGLQDIAQGGGYQAQQNQALQGAIDAGLGDITRNFQQNIMPGINTGAAMTNTSGGSRQGIAQGLAAQGANQQAADFVNRMYSDNFQNMQQNQLQSQQQQLGAYGMMGDLTGMQNQMLQSGLSMTPELSNLGFASQYGNLTNLANLLGGPTVLGGGGQTDSAILAPLQFGYSGGG